MSNQRLLVEQNLWRSRSASASWSASSVCARLAQHDAAVALAAGEVAALAVRRRTPHGLDRERRAALGEPARDARVRHGAEVVGVGDEDVAVAGVLEPRQQPGAAQGGVDVAVAGRAPLEVGGLGVRRRHQVRGEELGLLVLQELQRQAVDRQVLVAGEGRHRVGRGAEGVHEQQRQRGVVLLAQVQHLAGDDVEEAQPAAHAEQRLGALHAHRGAEAAVELDDRGPADRLGRDVVGHVDVGQRLHVERLDRVLGDHAGLAVLEEPVVVRERVDRDLVDPGLAHLLARELETSGVALACHASIVGCWGGHATVGRQPVAKSALRDQVRAARKRRPLDAAAAFAASVARRRAGLGSRSATPPPSRRTSPSAASPAPACCSTRSSPPASGCCCRWCCPTSTSTGRCTPDATTSRPPCAGCSSRPARGSAVTRSRGPTWCSSPARRVDRRRAARAGRRVLRPRARPGHRRDPGRGGAVRRRGRASPCRPTPTTCASASR